MTKFEVYYFKNNKFISDFFIESEEVFCNRLKTLFNDKTKDIRSITIYKEYKKGGDKKE